MAYSEESEIGTYPFDKIVIISDAIFTIIIRYGIAVYLRPVFEKEELKKATLPENTYTLQVLQNKMIRVILGLKRDKHINMERLRKKFQIMSVNQLAIYHPF